jgi:hypothetical protein
MPWVKGQSGNPAGQPRKGETLTALIERGLRVRVSGLSNKRAIALKVIEMARAGNLKAVEIILDRTEGKLTSDSAVEVNLLGNTVILTLEDAVRVIREQQAAQLAPAPSVEVSDDAAV